jgi:GNAT superfamily N-acetyltransferase
MSSERSVRRAALGDEPILRELRLQALREAPDAFGSTYEWEVARTTADWQRWMSPGVGLGGADELVAALVAWAHSERANCVRLKVIQGNERARRFYERVGFYPTGHQTTRGRDGQIEIEMERLVEPGSCGPTKKATPTR